MPRTCFQSSPSKMHVVPICCLKPILQMNSHKLNSNQIVVKMWKPFFQSDIQSDLSKHVFSKCCQTCNPKMLPAIRFQSVLPKVCFQSGATRCPKYACKLNAKKKAKSKERNAPQFLNLFSISDNPTLNLGLEAIRSYSSEAVSPRNCIKLANHDYFCIAEMMTLFHLRLSSSLSPSFSSASHH